MEITVRHTGIMWGDAVVPTITYPTDKEDLWGGTVSFGETWEDDQHLSACLSPEHNVPSHLYIPPGRRYVHVCPSCGYKAKVISPLIY